MYPATNKVRVIKSRRLRWSGHMARMENSRNASKILTGTPRGKGLLGRPRRRQEYNIRNINRMNMRKWIKMGISEEVS